MTNRGYYIYIRHLIDKIEYNIPIFIQDIAKELSHRFQLDEHSAMSITRQAIYRLNGSVLRRYQNNIYYKPKMTTFGISPLNPSLIHMNLYLRDRQLTIGYVTGATIANHWGLTSQISRYQYYVTNKHHQKTDRIIKKWNLILRKPLIEINQQNALYFQWLDVVFNKEKIPWDTQDPARVLLYHKQRANLLNDQLLLYADYYEEPLLIQKINRLLTSPNE